MSDTVLEIQGLNKSFSSTHANVNINFELKRGEVRALAGENGSGKSTLLSQIAGICQKDSGEMYINGERYEPKNTKDANVHKIAMVVQELGVVGTLPAAVNIFLGNFEPFTKCGVVSKRKIQQKVDEIIREWELPPISYWKSCGGMSVEDRKMVELIRALSIDPEILLLDEVTQALSHNNRSRLYKIIRRCKEMGKTIILISHDLDEVIDIADSITVLRDGVVVGTKQSGEVTLDELKMMMVGRNIAKNYYREDNKPSRREEVVLEVNNLEVESEFESLSFNVHAGEIVGFCGLSDSGIHDIGKALYGLKPLKNSDAVYFRKKGLHIVKPDAALRNGMAYLPKERDGEGLLIQATILDNIVLPSLKDMEGPAGYLSPAKLEKMTSHAVNKFEIKCTDINQKICDLSGGNKQKVNLGHWLIRDLDMLIMDCPTRGVDIGVKAYIYSVMREAKEQGLAMILISDELTEVLGMADRIFVVKTGKVVKEIMRGPDFSEQAVIEVMV